MAYVVRARQGNKVGMGRRVFKTLQGINRSIHSPAGQRFIKEQKLKNVEVVKIRTLKGRHF